MDGVFCQAWFFKMFKIQPLPLKNVGSLVHLFCPSSFHCALRKTWYKVDSVLYPDEDLSIKFKMKARGWLTNHILNKKEKPFMQLGDIFTG